MKPQLNSSTGTCFTGWALILLGPVLSYLLLTVFRGAFGRPDPFGGGLIFGRPRLGLK